MRISGWALTALLVPAAGAAAQDAPPRPRADIAESAAQLARAANPHDPNTDRAVYWFLADLYQEAAAQTADNWTAVRLRRAASRYEQAGPTPAEVDARGWIPGSRVTVRFDGGAPCETTVR